MDHETWRFLNTFAPWLSAVGTVSAVIVSLYLASRDRRIRLKVNAGLRKVAMTGQSFAQGIDIISIAVTNVGYRSAQISQLYWKLGVFRKRYLVQIPGTMPWSARLPTKLGDGDEASYPLELSIWGEEIDDFLKAISSSFPKLSAKWIKIGVTTSTGERFEARIEKGLQRWFLDEQLSKKKTQRSH